MGGRMRWVLSICLGGAMLPSLGAAQNAVPYFDANRTQGEQEAEQRILRALSQRMDFDFQDTPLRDVVDSLNSRGIPARLDPEALDDIGVAVDTPVRFRHYGVQVRSALDAILKQLELSWLIRQEMLVITTRDEAEADLRIRAYDVTHLLPSTPVAYYDGFGGKRTGSARDFDTLIDTVTSTVEPQTWDVVGGSGAIHALELHGAAMLVVSQTDRVQEQVARLLDTLQRVVARHQPASTAIRGSTMRGSNRLPGARLSSVPIGLP